MLAVYMVFLVVAAALMLKCFGRKSGAGYDAGENLCDAFPNRAAMRGVFNMPGKFTILFAFGIGFGAGGLLGLSFVTLESTSLLPALGVGILTAGAMWGLLAYLEMAAEVWAAFENISSRDFNSPPEGKARGLAGRTHQS